MFQVSLDVQVGSDKWVLSAYCRSLNFRGNGFCWAFLAACSQLPCLFYLFIQYKEMEGSLLRYFSSMCFVCAECELACILFYHFVVSIHLSFFFVAIVKN